VKPPIFVALQQRATTSALKINSSIIVKCTRSKKKKIKFQ
jgi:hypothetical protein